MTQPIFFISDLHLSAHKPALNQLFIDFLQTHATQAQAVYILGDLFDAWVGDDDFTAFAKRIRHHLKQLTAAGVLVYLQTGNRDFLLGQRFCAQTGMRLLDEYAVIDLFGTPTLLTHGDLLCTDDTAYQAFRVKAHNPVWQQSILSKPLLLRLFAARWYRLRSFLHKRQKTQDIMDVNQRTVLEVMQRYQCLRLIHGHTHRPAVHTFSIDAQLAQRFVLSQWHKSGVTLLSWTAQGYKTLPI